MKKWIASAGLLVLLVSLLIPQAQAAGLDTCPCCGQAYAACNWQPWTLTDGGENNALIADGHYYLTGDVTTIKSQVRIGNGTATPKITLDLQGHTIAGSQRVFGVYPGATLSIVDSVGGGTVEGKQVSKSQVGGVIRVNEGATLNLYGGTVKDVATTAHAANGAAIATEGKNVTINIAGGNVQGSQFAPQGGAIFAARGATVNISAGTVTGGSANLGGAVYVNNATLNITGGEIIGGTATTEGAAEGADAGFGGAVYACSNATVTVGGGKISGGAAGSGGAVALMSATMEITGGEIIGGTASGYGTAIHLLADSVNETAVPCTLNISGGKITGLQNSAKAAITIASNAHTVNISGGEIIGADKPGAGGSAVSGQGTAATIHITGGTITGAAGTDTNRSGVVYTRGFLNISDGTIEATGDGPAVYMYQNYGLLTVTGNAQTTLPGKVRLVENAKVAGGSGALTVTGSTTDGIWYQRGVDAVNNCPEGGFVRSFGGGILNLQGKTRFVDVNGQKLTIRNGTFYGFDSTNDGYNAAKSGTVTLDTANGGICGASYTVAPNGNKYICVDNGSTLSFHRYDIQLPYVYLRTAKNKEGIFYGATLQADSAAISAIKTLGVALTPHEMADEAAWTAAMDDLVKRSTYSTEGLVASKVNELRSTSLINIININNDTIANNRNANTLIYARPYIELKDGSFLYGDGGACSMKQILQYANQRYHNFSDSQKQGLLGMYERFRSLLKGWNLNKLKADYNSGNPLILDYRRDLAVAAMRAQLEVLWTVDKEVVYSKSSGSLGPDADLANYKAAQEAAGKTYNPLNDQIITLYPDRIYQGLPYTHASSSLDALAQFGEQDENGVYNIQNAHTSLFSGGSTDGSAVDKATGQRTGQFNVARLGNDCWDMVHFAWGQFTEEISSTQTRELTPSYGVQWIGEEILLNAMKANNYVTPDNYDTTAEGSTLLKAICSKNSKGQYVYRSIPEKDANGNTITNHDVDGTRLVRYGTQTQNADGTYDYQAIYQTYAMMQPGDGMVTWKNGSGHAIMVVDVNIVSDGKGGIDGDQSTIVLLEQGSGHEERQSRLVSEFDSAVSAQHASHTSVKNTCLYCAGYTDEKIGNKHIWKLDYGEQVRTFKQIAEGDNIAFTCAALNNVDPAPAARVAINSAADGFLDFFKGSLSATYRITSVSFEINGNGKNFSGDCIGTQSAVSTDIALSQLLTDSSCGIGDSSVLTGDLPLKQDAEGNITADMTKLSQGEYTFTFSCTLNSGHTFVLRSGVFQVEADGTITESPFMEDGPITPTTPATPEE